MIKVILSLVLLYGILYFLGPMIAGIFILGMIYGSLVF